MARRRAESGAGTEGVKGPHVRCTEVLNQLRGARVEAETHRQARIADRAASDLPDADDQCDEYALAAIAHSTLSVMAPALRLSPFSVDDLLRDANRSVSNPDGLIDQACLALLLKLFSEGRHLLHVREPNQRNPAGSASGRTTIEPPFRILPNLDAITWPKFAHEYLRARAENDASGVVPPLKITGGRTIEFHNLPARRKLRLLAFLADDFCDTEAARDCCNRKLERAALESDANSRGDPSRRVGAAVEVSMLANGFRGSYYCATVQKLDERGERILVKYDILRSRNEGSKALEEWIELEPHVRFGNITPKHGGFPPRRQTRACRWNQESESDENADTDGDVKDDNDDAVKQATANEKQAHKQQVGPSCLGNEAHDNEGEQTAQGEDAANCAQRTSEADEKGTLKQSYPQSRRNTRLPPAKTARKRSAEQLHDIAKDEEQDKAFDADASDSDNGRTPARKTRQSSCVRVPKTARTHGDASSGSAARRRGNVPTRRNSHANAALQQERHLSKGHINCHATSLDHSKRNGSAKESGRLKATPRFVTRLRPVPPLEQRSERVHANRNFGDHVEVFGQDGYWLGVVKGEKEDGTLTIFLPGENQTVDAGREDVRTALRFDGHEWRQWDTDERLSINGNGTSPRVRHNDEYCALCLTTSEDMLLCTACPAAYHKTCIAEKLCVRISLVCDLECESDNLLF